LQITDNFPLMHQYKLLVYSRCGTSRFSFYIPTGTSQPVSTAITGEQYVGNDSSALQPTQPKAITPPNSTNGAGNAQADSSGGDQTAADNLKRSKSTSGGLNVKSQTKGKGKRVVSTNRRRPEENEMKVSDGGLGIRQVIWSPSGKMLAIGGYDEKVSDELLPLT
jgi:hypothetical protein